MSNPMTERTESIDKPSPSVVISSEMVEAGVLVLRESGFVERPSSGDFALIREILRTALAIRRSDAGHLLVL